MAKIGNWYGSECHLMRWMGRHRNLFDQSVSESVGRPGSPIHWLDFNFAPNNPWPDAELQGLKFLYDRPGLKSKWQKFWPTQGGVQNWDAVGWIGKGANQELLLLEAKSHVKEMTTNCGATSATSIEKITSAFDEVKRNLGARPDSDWFHKYYQAFNRMATLYFLQRDDVPAHLIFLDFLGDRVPGKQCPHTPNGWKPAINNQWAHLGLTHNHLLADRVHSLFLPISIPLPRFQLDSKGSTTAAEMRGA